MILHVQQQGAELRLEHNLLVVHSREGDVAAAHIPLLEGVVVYGGVHLSAPVVTRLLAEGIDCVFLTQDGRYKGRLQAPTSRPALRRALQAMASASPEFRLIAARLIVRNKLFSQARVARALLRPRGRTISEELRRLARALASYQRLSEVQGAEGYASRLYFGALRGVLPEALRPWTRTHRGAGDGLNALLNYGYAVLAARTESAVLTAGLDQNLGFLHQFGRPRLPSCLT